MVLSSEEIDEEFDNIKQVLEENGYNLWFKVCPDVTIIVTPNNNQKQADLVANIFKDDYDVFRERTIIYLYPRLKAEALLEQEGRENKEVAYNV